MVQIIDYLKDGAFTLLVSAPVYLLLRWLIVRSTCRKTHVEREVLLAVFCLSVVWLASETVLPEFSVGKDMMGRIRFTFQPQFHSTAAERLQTGYMMNFIPFETVKRYTSFQDFGSSAVNLVGNVAMFLPLGIFPPLLWKKMRRLWAVLLLGFCSSCFIEFIQVFIDRSVDIDDVILNTAGVVLGYLLVQCIFLLVSKTKNVGLNRETI